MANKNNINGIVITGRLKQSGITVYLRNGKLVARTASSYQPKRRTRKQFIARQRMHHSTRMWAKLRMAGKPLFPDEPTAYARFLSLMNRTEAVFIPNSGLPSDTTLLVPDIPVSEGVLPTVKQHLGEVDRRAALVTGLKRDDLRKSDKLLLYTLTQMVEGMHTLVHFSRREVSHDELTETAEGLALTGDDYGDPMKGWALVHLRGERCSTQTAVSRCTYYQRFTTEEALQEAAESFGGLTDGGRRVRR